MNKFAYFQGKIIPIAKAVVPISAKAIQYGLGHYTGMRAHYNKEQKQLYIFRLRDHYKRMKDSAKQIGMKFPYTYKKFEKIILDLCKKNHIKEDTYIRVTNYSSDTTITPKFDNPHDDLAIYMFSLKNYFHKPGGLKVLVSKWRRIESDAIPVKAKITGSYVNSALAKSEALNKGYDEALFLNRDGSVCEATGANLFGVKNGKIITPPLSANNLDGITRRTVIELFDKELKITVQEKKFREPALYKFDELFFTGTAAKVTPIIKVNKKRIGKGLPGPLLAQMRDLINQISYGNHPKYKKWLTPVY